MRLSALFARESEPGQQYGSRRATVRMMLRRHHQRSGFPPEQLHHVLVSCLVVVLAIAGITPGVDAQEPLVAPSDAMSIRYVPPPEPVPEHRKKIKEKNAEKPYYRRPWASNDRPGRWKAIGLGSAGLLVGFLTHELGHVLMNLAYGSVPNFEGVRWAGFIPFFRISSRVSCNDEGCFRNGEPFKGGRSGAYMITSAGFNVQHVVNEVVLSLNPGVMHNRSPFQKGMLFFNLSLSIGYSLSTWFQVKPPIGDIEGMSSAAQINPNWVALIVMIPTGLDIYRFFVPDSKWAPWVSRSSKAVFLGISFIWKALYERASSGFARRPRAV
ncbi:MAG: hypothetical protein WBG86_17980 [Polyangiales bacterium]